MTRVSPPHASVINGDGLIALTADVVKLAVRDLRRGPGGQAKTRQRYVSALAFLDRIGLLDRVVATYQLELEDPNTLTNRRIHHD